MSYCRWSSDNWKCDLYCYKDVHGGWTTHVAGRRRVGLDQLPPDPLLLLTAGGIDSGEWHKKYVEHHAILESLPFEEITLPYAGATFNDSTLESFREHLLHLRSVGYNFPDYVLEEIDQEIKERDQGLD